MTIPNGPAEITAAWLSSVTDWSVDGASVEQIGIGVGVTGALYRASLDGTGCPESVVVKLAALDPLAAGTAVALGLYRREVTFYAELADECPITTPACFHHDIDANGEQFVIVMEDRGDTRVVDQVVGVDLADAERIVDRLADWHATWWGDTAELIERGVAVPVGSPLYPATLPALFVEGWDKLSAEVPHVVDGLEDVGKRYGDSMAATLQALDEAPTTLLHGDYRADNMLFDADDELVLLDFQILGSGSPAYDLAYFISQSLDADLAAAHERELFDRWRTRLLEHRSDADLDGEWERYRMATLFCISYPVIAARGMDLTDPRQKALIETMMGRMRRACDDLDLIELWR